MLTYTISMITEIKQHERLKNYSLRRYIGKRSGCGKVESVRYAWSRKELFNLNEPVPSGVFAELAYTPAEADMELISMELYARRDGN